MESFDVSNTMKVLFSEEKGVDYIVFKIGNETFSTDYEDIVKGIIKGKIQIVETKGIGEQHQLWIKGRFTEKENHEKLEKEVPFELNVYFHNQNDN